MGIFYLDYENGNNNFGGTSFNPIASGTNGRISGSIFSSATANFPNDNTIAGSKNLLGSAERFDNNNIWGLSAVSILPSNVTIPESGLDYVWFLQENSTTNTHDLRTAGTNFSLNTSNQHTVSYYVKSNGTNEITIKFGSNSIRSARYNLLDGTVSQVAASATAAISGVGDGWYRVSLTATPNTSSDIIYLGLTNNAYNSTDIQSYAGNGINGIYVSSPQLEVSSSVTSYEKPPYQYLSIWNGSAYVTYLISNYINSTSLYITAIQGGTSLANQSVDRQYYIGGRWKTFENGATATRLLSGDTIRIMASPDPTAVGNATFVSNKSEASTTKNISSSTNASPISITLNNHGYSTGDTIVISSHNTNTNANGVWTITSTGTNTFTLNNSTGNGVGSGGTAKRISNAVITLSSAVTTNIASTGNRGEGRTVWTSANGNVTANHLTTDYKDGDVSDQIAIAAGFTTGNAAYKAMSSSLDLSGYQQVSFWIKQTAGTAIIDNDISLVLCSDSVGAVAVNTVNVPMVGLINRWVPMTVNLNTNLGNNINSIALYVNVDRGAQTFLLSNIIACKSVSSNDSLNLCSLVGKNTTEEKWWGPIQSINGTRVILDQETQYLPTNTNLRGYFGTSETTTLYKRETIKTTPLSTTSSNAQNCSTDTGYEFLKTKLEFGYDRSNMSSRTGESFFDGKNGTGVGLFIANRNHYSVSNVGLVRYTIAYQPQGVYFFNMDNHWYIGNTQIGCYYYGVYKSNINNITCCFNSGYGYYMSVNSAGNMLTNIFSLGNTGNGIHFDYSSNISVLNSKVLNNGAGILMVHCQNNIIKNCLCDNNTGGGMGTGSGNSGTIFLNCTTNNNQYSVICGGMGTNFIKNCTLNEASEASSFSVYSNGRTIFSNNDNSTDNYIHYLDYGFIYTTKAVRYSNSGFAWALAPTATNRDVNYPLNLSIAKIAVSANKLVIVKAWVRRTNTQLTMGMRIKNDQIAGVPNDITSYMTAAANTWEQITISFTPTEVGVVEILAECYGGSTYTGYIDDLSIVQL